MLRPLLILAALAPAALAAPSVEQDALPGLPAVKVQDLHYGDVLFHFYQQDYFDSLVRLAAYRDQGRLAAHARDAELLRGGLYLSLGQHREAREIFERLLADPATPADVKGRAWFYLGKLLYASGEYEQSDRALRQSAGTLPEELEAERRLLIAQGLLYRKRYDQAIAELSNWQGPRYWLLYGQFNLGVALVRAGEPERGLALLDARRQLETKWPELMALRDKANLAIGYARLQAGEPAAARAALERVRLSGPAVQQGAARRRLGRRGGEAVRGRARCRGRSCRAATCSTRRCRNPTSPCPMPTPSSARWRRRSSTTSARSRPTTPSARGSANRSTRSARATCWRRR